MPLLPNHQSALLDLSKLEDYCLSADHPRGRHKARPFAASLGIAAQDAAWLRTAILNGLGQHDSIPQETDSFGQRWRVDMLLARQNHRAMIRTIWMIRSGETFPRFITCWVI